MKVFVDWLLRNRIVVIIILSALIVAGLFLRVTLPQAIDPTPNFHDRDVASCDTIAIPTTCTYIWPNRDPGSWDGAFHSASVRLHGGGTSTIEQVCINRSTLLKPDNSADCYSIIPAPAPSSVCLDGWWWSNGEREVNCRPSGD